MFSIFSDILFCFDFLNYDITYVMIADDCSMLQNKALGKNTWPEKCEPGVYNIK